MVEFDTDEDGEGEKKWKEMMSKTREKFRELWKGGEIKEDERD